MSLTKMLAKVAVGVAIAKGAQAVMKNNQKGGKSQSGGLGGLLGGLGGSTGGTGGGSLQNMLGGLLGGGAAAGGARSGGLGGLLENLGGGTQGGTARSGQGGLGGMLSGLAGAAGAGGLLGGLGSTMQKAPAQNNESFGAVLNSQFDETPEAPIEPSQDQEALSALMLTAMIQAAKSDGVFDDAEKEKLLGHLGDVDEEEAAFVQAQMQAPVDVDALVANTPEGLAPQIYTVSVMAIDLDTRDEAEYLHKLATGYGMTPAQVNEIHAELGVPSLYT